jgi:hypothetical protein
MISWLILIFLIGLLIGNYRGYRKGQTDAIVGIQHYIKNGYGSFLTFIHRT